MARLNVPIPDELDEKLNLLLPWGIKSAIVRAMCEQLLVSVKEKGLSVIELIISNKLNIIEEMQNGNDRGRTRPQWPIGDE
jgi:hypothetical protein